MTRTPPKPSSLSRGVIRGLIATASFLLFAPSVLSQSRVKHALLIGINRSQAEIENVPRLRFARADAQELKEELIKGGWDARAILDDEATPRRIVTELVRLAGEANPRDVVLIYFAGHGLRDKTGRPHTYWLTYSSTLSTLAVDALRLSHVMSYLDEIPALQKIVILDHCYSGDVERLVSSSDGTAPRGPGEGDVTLTRNLFPQSDFTTEVTANSPGLVVLGAARDDAYEFDDIKHGMFTHGLLAALRNSAADADDDGKLSFLELWIYAKKEMKRVADDKHVVQLPIEILQGQNISDWTDLFTAALDTADKILAEADSLNAFLTRLDLDIDPALTPAERNAWGRARAFSVSAITSWRTAATRTPPQEPSPNDVIIVNELRLLKELAVPASTKKTMLQFKTEALGNQQ